MQDQKIDVYPENIYENLKISQEKDYYSSDNIYENICNDCGRIYDNICGFCNDELLDTPLIHSRNGGSSKKFFTKLFQKRFKSSGLKRSNSKIQKNEIFIVHDTCDSSVFRTNCTFDLDEMCRMRESEGSHVIYENLRRRERTMDACVNAWIESISAFTEDYEHFVEYSVKSIPSKTFCEREWNKNCVWDFGKSKEIDSQEKVLDCDEETFHDKTSVDTCSHNNSSISHDEIPISDDVPEQNVIIAPPIEVISVSTIVRKNNIDDEFYSFNKNNKAIQQHIPPPYLYLNKLLLSISLNTITLSYDKYLKKISYIYQLKIQRKKSTDNFCSAGRQSTARNVSGTFGISFKNPEATAAADSQIPRTRTQLSKIKLLSSCYNNKNESLVHPFMHDKINSISSHNNSQKYKTQIIMENENEVNNDIYYYIWNCDSTSPTMMTTSNEEKSLEIIEPQEKIEDEQNWVSAHDDFASADDLMDVVDENPRQLLNDNDNYGKLNTINEEISRSYSSVIILYNENPKNNQIIYEDTKSKQNLKRETPEKKDSSEVIFDTETRTLDLNLFQDSVREFLMTIGNEIEEEDELVRNFLF